MKVIVIGAGLIGLTAAYSLRLRGHDVTVIDRQGGPGRETSFANGALLTPSMPEPWNAPGCWRVLLKSLAQSNAPLQLRLKALPQLAGWGFTFLRNSRRETFERSSVSNVRLALYSLKMMQFLRQKTGIEYGAAAPGAIKIFRNSAALEQAFGGTNRLASEGLTARRLSPQETVELEPALAPIATQLAGSIHYPDDETGNAFRFCGALMALMSQLGVQFRFERTVEALEVRSAGITAVRTSSSPPADERFVADQYVIAAGSYSEPLLRPLGIRLPVRPAKGYSVTFDTSSAAALRPGPMLSTPVIDDDMHAAIVPLGDRIRAAGTAEFAGFDLTLRPERVLNLVKLALKVLPRAGLDPATAKPWCGLRPMSADGVPIIGQTAIPNLWLSTGHGHLGWTMAAGSGELLANLMSREAAAIDPAPYDPRRFAGLD